MGQLSAELDFTSVDTVLRGGLHEYLDRLQMKMNAVGSSLREDFVVRVTPSTPASLTPGQSQNQNQSA